MFYAIKDPAAVLDYKFDFAALTNGSGVSNWLESGETISSVVVTVPTGITLDSDSITDTSTSVTIWLSGGTAKNSYLVACKIVTSSGRTDERTLLVQVINR